MKGRAYLGLVALATVVCFSSCSKSSDSDTELSFSTLSVEKQKQSIEQNGIDLINKMDGVQTIKAFTAVDNLGNLMDATPAYVKSLVALRSGLLRNDLKAVSVFAKAMSISAASGDNETWGTHTWNKSLREFVYTKGVANTIIVNFPSTASATSNNAVLTIQLANSAVAVPVDIDTDGVLSYMPSSVTVSLKVDGASVLESSYTATYNSDATPVTVKETLSADVFSWTFNYTNNGKDMLSSYVLTKSGETLMKAEVGAAGSLTLDAFTEFANSDSEDPSEVLNSANVYYQIMNLAFVGQVKDVKSMMTDYKAVSEKLSDKAYNDQMVTVLNKYMKVYGYFVSEKKKFAEVEVYNYDDVYADYVYNASTSRWVYTQNVSHYELMPRMVLSDGSKVSMEDYVKVGFEDLLDKLESYQ